VDDKNAQNNENKIEEDDWILNKTKDKRQKKKKILLVDDVAFNMQALKIVLKFEAKIDVDSICS